MKDYDIANISINLHKFKTDSGLTIQELAQKSGVSHDTLVKIMGKKVLNPSVKTLAQISSTLKIPLQRFLESE